MSAAVPARDHMSIGEVLASLQPDFPDVTVSKIRFLEAEGLVEPARTPSGYRRFAGSDLERLRYVLTAQRDHYLPLRVIKDHLDAIDRGLEPPRLASAEPRVPESAMSGDDEPGAADFTCPGAQVRLARGELLAEAGISETDLDQLESFGVVSADSDGFYDADAALITATVARMSRFGLGARHLRTFAVAADREVGLIEQVVAPVLRRPSGQGRAEAEQVVGELAALSVRLHAALVRAGVRRSMTG